MRMHNMDFSKRIVIDTKQEEWIESPASGVRRIPLEREEAEAGHTISIVEYLVGASFDKHSLMNMVIMKLEPIFEIRRAVPTHHLVKRHDRLEVFPLQNFMTEGVALVKWPAREKFIKHTHFGGNE